MSRGHRSGAGGAAVVGLDWPQIRLTVNLSPSGVRKTGAGFDLAIALGVLVVSEQLTPESVQGSAPSASSGSTGRCDRSTAWWRWPTPFPRAG
ncbi:MAG: magnesium chelatase domain-containing protein [Acidimicrobiales bacterium]